MPKKEEKRKNKNVAVYFTVCLGDSVDLDYKATENGIEYDHTLKLSSGDAFVVDQTCKTLKMRVKKVHAASKPKDLVLREGSLLLNFEKE